MPAPFFPRFKKKRSKTGDYFVHFLKFLGGFMLILAAALFVMQFAATNIPS